MFSPCPATDFSSKKSQQKNFSPADLPLRGALVTNLFLAARLNATSLSRSAHPASMRDGLKTVCFLGKSKGDAINSAINKIKILTVSIGYVYINHYKTINTLFAQADRALYYVKQNGRNSINGYDELLHSGKIMPIKASDDIELF